MASGSPLTPAHDLSNPALAAPNGDIEAPAVANNTHGSTGSTVILNAAVESEADRFKRLKVFNAEQFDAVKIFVNKLDGKEIAAAGRIRAETKETLLKHKRAVAGLKKKRRRFWSCRAENHVIDPSGFDTEEEGLAIDAELGGACMPQCYDEIKKLLVLECHPVYSRALVEWSRKESLFTSRVERKQKRVAHLKNEIYQLIGFFSVFQGVLLTAVAQSNLLHCHNWWSPILLSLVASFVTIAGVVQKLMKIHDFQYTIHREEQALKIVVHRLSSLRGEGIEKFEFSKFANKEAPKQSTRRFWTYFSVVIGSLIIFTVIFPLSHWRILCDSGPK